jgi:GTP cyclohydrolase II
VSAFQVKKKAEAELPTRWGKFRVFGFEGGGFEGAASEGTVPGEKRVDTAVALVMGDVTSTTGAAPLMRIHSQCLTGDVLGSLRCDCRQQLEKALSMIADEGKGILIYEQQEGRGIGLMAKLQAYALQDQGRDTVEANQDLGFAADLRLFQLPAEILKQLGVKRVRLLSNNPQKLESLTSAGIEVTERVPCEVEPNSTSKDYLRTKKEKLGHLFS